MAVSSTSTVVSYTGNGSTTSFAVTFPLQGTGSAAELEVVQRTILTGAEAVLSYTTHYTVTGGSGSTGTVVMASAPANTVQIHIRRTTTRTQTVDYTANDPFPADTHELALDRLAMSVQEIEEELDRSFKVSRTNSITTAEFTESAAARANKLMAFDASGNLDVTQEIGIVRGNWAASTSYSIRDIVKDTSTNNIFIALAAHTSSGSQPLTTNTDSAKWSLLVDAASSTTSATAAATSATASASSATAAASSATASASSASTASGHKDTATTKAAEAAASAVVSAGEASALAPKYTFSTTTGMADPGAGALRFNNATVSSVSSIAIDDQTADTGNPDIEAWILTWDDSTSTVKGVLRLVEPGTPANYAVFHVTGLTNGSGFVTLAVTHIDSNGTFGNGDSIRVTFDRTGAKGDTGSTGVQGPRGEQPGLRMLFETTTTDADQGAGKISLNNGTASSATVMFVDDVDVGAVSVNDFVDSWDDSTNSALRGHVTIAKTSAPENYHIFLIRAATVSASTYSKVAVTHVLSAGTISDGDAVNVSFVRTGNAGADGEGSGDLVDPMTTQHDIIVRGSSEAERLAKGGNSTVLNVNASGVVGYSTVTSAMIANDAVTLAKMAPGTDGNLISFDTSGNPVAVAAGTDGQVLTSAGPGAVCLFEDAAGGGGLTLIGTQDADNSSSTMTQTGLTGSDIYMVVLSQITGDSGTNFGVRVGDSSSIRSGASDYSAVATRFQDNAIGPYATGPSTGTDKILFASSGTGASGTGWVQAVFYITNPVSGTARAGIYGQNQTINNGGNMSTGPFSGSTTAAIAVDRVQILPTSGNIITGSMTVYKFNQS